MDNTLKKLLFMDRDGTLIVEPPVTEQVDTFEQLEFLPRVIQDLSFLRHKLDYDFVIVSNQDGLGSAEYPLDRFKAINDLMLRVFHSEGVDFDDIHFDSHRPEDNHPDRKPGTGMLARYIEGNGTEYDLAHSYVIGDRITDIRLAHNLGCKGILIASPASSGPTESIASDSKDFASSEKSIQPSADQFIQAASAKLAEEGLSDDCVLVARSWDEITAFLFAGSRRAEVRRTTRETDIHIAIDLDGSGRTDISTGLGFFDHMLEQIGKHSGMDLTIHVKGDLNVDEHHTIEDTGIALGTCIAKALGDKRGIARYGFCLPMDDCLCQVALDFSGRPWLVWDAEFHREKVGDMPTEMFLHFFKSFSDAAAINLNIKAEGQNEHHKIEGIFKALARALKMAINRDIHHFELPSSKGVL